MKETSQLTFRISFWRHWLLAVTPFALLGTVGLTTSIVAGNRVVIASLLLSLAAVAVVLLLPISLTVQAVRWHVDPGGIGGPNNWLVYHRLEWSQIESVEPWMLPGYRYVQVNGKGRRWVFWLPLFLTDMPGLRSAVAQYAPPTNPLRRYLENH